MEEPAKPFACTLPECGMSFTNEDRLNVHTKKHDMELQLGLEQKAGFVADETPTPTRFIRNCEEVGLFQDLQNVNPFDEGFKRAMETKKGILSLESALSGADDALHTPQMVFPLADNPETTFYSAANNQRSVTISRSSSDESGTIKEYETTTISKLTNEVTTISRIVGNRDVVDKIVNSDEMAAAKSNDTPINKDNSNIINEKVYTNNVIKIHSNVEIRQDGVLNINNNKNTPMLIYTDSVVKDSVKDVLLADNTKLQVEEKVPPIMSQKSLDFVVDSLTKDMNEHKHFDIAKKDAEKATKAKDVSRKTSQKSSPEKKIDLADNKNIKAENADAKRPKLESQETADEYEVIIKLPGGKKVKMKPVDETPKADAKEVIRKRLTNKRTQKLDTPLQKMLQLHPGTLIPVTLVNPIGVPIPMAPKKLPLPANPKNTSVVTELKTVIIANRSNNVNIVPVISVESSTELPRPSKRVLDRTKADKSKKDRDINNEANSTELSDTAKRKEGQEKQKELVKSNNNISSGTENDSNVITIDDDDECAPAKTENNAKKDKFLLESRSAASKRYRVKLKDTMRRQAEKNRILEAENAALKLMVTEHTKCCSNAMDLSARLEKLRNYLSSRP